MTGEEAYWAGLGPEDMPQEPDSDEQGRGELRLIIELEKEIDCLQIENARLAMELAEGQFTAAEREFLKGILKQHITYLESLKDHPRFSSLSREKLKMISGLFAKVCTG